MTAPMTAARRFEPGIQAGLFLLFLALPALDAVFDLDPTKRPPNQARVSAPAAPQDASDLKGWRDGYESYLDDSFGWRSWAVRSFNRLNYRLFRVSERRNVVVGRDDWLYFGSAAVEYHRATAPFSNAELRRRGQSIERRRQWLAKQGVQYLFAIAPNKHSIYPEHLPSKYLRTGPVSRYEQLAEYLENETGVTVVDLHSPLLVAKQKEQVYERSGSHWNSRGAHIAYRAIHDQLSQWFPVLDQPVAWETIELAKRGPGELVRMQGLEGMIDEQLSRPIGGLHHTRLKFKGKGRLVTERDDVSLPRALIFHDSFIIAEAPFLAEHFSHATFEWRSAFDGELVQQLKPDVVIEQRVERNLLLPAFRSILPPAVAEEGTE